MDALGLLFAVSITDATHKDLDPSVKPAQNCRYWNLPCVPVGLAGIRIAEHRILLLLQLFILDNCPNADLDDVQSSKIAWLLPQKVHPIQS